ncbi:MAG: AAA family ATPase [Thermodesulfobacteriota bacterium]|nr:AAA family ATPase [Thermodesulfobacteriota bacterium]
MPTMFTRELKKITTSAFLLGPRGTGKSTWIQKNYKNNSVLYDLLNTTELIRLSRDPSLLYHETAHLAPGSWVIVDEIQKVPTLLNEVHRIIEEKKINFILSGSSARKLRKSGVNLLAGRALTYNLFPLVSKEVGFKLDLKKQIAFGMLPSSFLSANPKKYLQTYAETYLKEEIREEALTRNFGNFTRFLEIAARQNGQLTNTTSIARDAGVARQTVQGYFDILIDTLIGFWLEPWKLKRATKQVSHLKFYFFDSGVVRALSGRLPYPVMPEESGPLFECFIINEIRAYLHYTELDYPLRFWRSQGNVEVDILLETSTGYVAIELKNGARWEKKFNRGMHRLSKELGKNKVACFGVFMGERQLTMDNVTIYPALDFLRRLWSNKIIDA